MSEAAVSPAREAELLARGRPPSWAEAWGRDAFGVFAGFRVGAVEQRMRWIPAGSFVMGSPEGEEGRESDEGPQHRVVLTQGFWLADTPCTQALWREVVGDAPSDFKGPRRPVEGVSWDDVQRFCAQLGERVEGLRVGLPTEAEWEYACRADAPGRARYGELDAIAWYSDNSEGQTADVARKQPNAWGLYDMLGNVWEWCHDGRRDYEDAEQVDPVGRGPSRVIRGGSWAFPARGVRAAFRYWVRPGYRSRYLGFRLARGQALREQGQQAR